MSTSDYLVCPECGASNAEGPLCSRCGKSIAISADQFPKLLRQRLLGAGFIPLVPTQSDSESLAPLAELFEETAHPLYDSLMMFPNLLLPPQSIIKLDVAAIVKGSDDTAGELQTLAGNILTQASSFLQRLSRPRILRVQIQVYVVYPEALTPEHVRAHRLHRRERATRVRRKGLSFGTGVAVTFIPIDCERGKAHFASRYLEPDRQARAALRQLQELNRTKAEQPFFKKYVRLIVTKPLEGLQTYLKNVGLAGEPDMLAHQITSGSLNAKELFRAVGVSALIAGLVAYILRLDLGGVNFGIGLLNKVVDGLITMIVFLVSAAFTHLPLRLAGGRAPFRSTFLATTFISAAFYPLLVGVVGVMVILGAAEHEAWLRVQAGTTGIMVLVLGAVHGLSWKRTLLALTLPLIALAVIVIVIVALVAP